jgi:hypothetical protein
MTEEETFVAGLWYDPRYEIVDLSDDVWWLVNGFEKRLKQAYAVNTISQEEYYYMTEPAPPMDGEETERCHEIMVKLGLLRRVAQA